MMKWMLAAGAAALAITAPSAAERGGDKGGGKGHAAHAQKTDRGGGQKARAQGGGGDRQISAERRGGNREVRAARTDRGNDRAQRQRFVQDDNRGSGRDRDNIRRGSRGDDDRVRIVRSDDDRGRGRGRDDARAVRIDPDGDAIRDRGQSRFADSDRIFRVRDVDRRGTVRFRDVDRDDLFVRQLGFGNGGCPPGLAKKPVACMPPGQAAKLVGQPLLAASRLAALDPLPLSMRSLFLDDDDHYYRYGGGYLYRVDRDDDLIASMIPLFGAALLGQPLQPAYLNNGYRPSYFNAFYPNSPYDCYDYGYGYVYERDCMTGMVEDVIPTYDNGYGVGQLMPASYGYYNVPFQYRSAFVDDDDHYYRYAPGSIYRVDRETSLISAVAALLTNGLSVGQPLPAGYSAYNVPMAYRSDYYDRPDAWYRYDNGYIYAVDPGTRMVRSVAYTIV
ncbi:MAG: hypothetical protein M3Q19_04070 [Pseudomonadota bacterium]|nr:hypothetical protein [Pseudomonadota bacterium]